MAHTRSVETAASPVIDPDALAETAQGAMSVRQAMVFTGDSRPRLYQLMSAGTLEWFSAGRDRRITRKSLHEYLAVLYAARKQITSAGTRS